MYLPRMFDKICIDILLMIIDHLPLARIFLMINKNLHGKTIQHPPILLWNKCRIKHWQGCYEEICKSKYLCLLTHVVLIRRDYVYLGRAASIEVVKLLVDTNPMANTFTLMERSFQYRNALPIIHLIDRKEYLNAIMDKAIYYSNIDVIKHFVSKGFKLPHHLLVRSYEQGYYGRELNNYLTSIPPESFSHPFDMEQDIECEYEE
jgi:hypothetical protein